LILYYYFEIKLTENTCMKLNNIIKTLDILLKDWALAYSALCYSKILLIKLKTITINLLINSIVTFYIKIIKIMALWFCLQEFFVHNGNLY
jgi:hypothetical protein